MKCEHCGAHIEETEKRCPYCNSYNEHYKKPEPPKPQTPPVQPVIQHIVQPAPQPQIIKEIVYVKDDKTTKNDREPEHRNPVRQKKARKPIVSLFLAIMFVFGAIFIYNAVNSKAKSANTATFITTTTKVKPSVTGKQTLSGVEFTVYAKDNYTEVQVVYEIYDSSKKIIKTGTLYGHNYKKGNSYTLSQSLSVSEQLSFDTIQYRIGSYK